MDTIKKRIITIVSIVKTIVPIVVKNHPKKLLSILSILSKKPEAMLRSNVLAPRRGNPVKSWNLCAPKGKSCQKNPSPRPPKTPNSQL